MEEKNKYKIEDLQYDDENRPHVAEQGAAKLEEIDEHTPAVEVEYSKGQDVQFEPQPPHAVDRETEQTIKEENEEELDR